MVRLCTYIQNLYNKGLDNRGLIFFTLLDYNRNQMENDRYWQKNFELFSKMFENVQFFAFALKVAKSANMAPHKSFRPKNQ